MYKKKLYKYLTMISFIPAEAFRCQDIYKYFVEFQKTLTVKYN